MLALCSHAVVYSDAKMAKFVPSKKSPAGDKVRLQAHSFTKLHSLLTRLRFSAFRPAPVETERRSHSERTATLACLSLYLRSRPTMIDTHSALQ